MMYIKGASEIILESCQNIEFFDGSTSNLDVGNKTNVE